MNRLKIFMCAFCVVIAFAEAQTSRDYLVHKRGMLHETIFNTGEIGRAYDQGNSGSVAGAPSFEWPGGSDAIVDAVHYNGQYNSFGGGMYLGVTTPDTVARLYAFCGGAGYSQPEPVMGKYSFPISFTRMENYPVLANGALNSAYDPNEAEEVIVSKWGTPTGLTVTRTSRAWSYPDYDDFIIYEYEIENTGDKDGNLSTVESNSTLTDVLVSYTYGLAPSMFGYERRFNRWLYQDFENKDIRARFDRNRWLNYAIDRDGKPDSKYFDDWASQDINGGGLLSPQAVGFSVLYYDTTHLAVKGETQMQIASADSPYVWDSHLHLKQPYLNKIETSNMRITKVTPYIDVAVARKNNPYAGSKVGLWGPDWIGRGSFNARQSQYFAIGRILTFGPYTMKHGDKVRFAIAEVAGYGAARLEETQAGLKDEGGSCGQNCGELADSAFFTVPNWTSPITINGIQYGSAYLASHNLPGYVNSNTITVREVTDRAIEAYTGVLVTNYDSLQYWPEQSPDHGVYAMPIPVPAPSITIESAESGQERIVWEPQVETFSAPRMQGTFDHYELEKAGHPLGPWIKLAYIAKGDPQYFLNGKYKFTDANSNIADKNYYSVRSVDNNGNTSGRTNISQFSSTAAVAANEKLPQSFRLFDCYPNPFNPSTTISFSIPSRTYVTLKIFDVMGRNVATLAAEELAAGTYSRRWEASGFPSGLYFYRLQAAGHAETKRLMLLK